jgi:hypothetical protein
MINEELTTAISRLDGYLSGVLAIEGLIRQYSAFAFILQPKQDGDSLESMIRDFFAPHATLQLSNLVKLGGLGDLEHIIRPHLIRRPLALGEGALDQQAILDRQKFLAFRVLDLIASISPEAGPSPNVYKIEGQAPESRSQSTFFCMQLSKGFLVLQFNDDSLALRTPYDVSS